MLPEEIQTVIKDAKKEMDEATTYCKRELSHIRAGKASPNLLDGVKVEYYGTQTPLNQLANVSAPEARLLTIEPYDKNAMKEIEKAIMSAGLGLNPNNDGNIIRIPLPILSEERREELVKKAKEIAEDARISVRNARRDAKDKVKERVKKDSLPEDAKFEAEDQLQNHTDKHINKIDELLEKKEEDIMTV